MSASSQPSPLTGIIDESMVVLDFGKYEGKTVKEIADADPAFYSQLLLQKESGIFAIRRGRDKSFRLYVNPLTKIDS